MNWANPYVGLFECFGASPRGFPTLANRAELRHPFFCVLPFVAEVCYKYRINRADWAASRGAAGETGDMRATEGNGVEQILKADIQSSVRLEEPALAPIAVPAGARWREFRIQVLPFLAFGASMLLAGVLWHRAVVPVPVEAE